MFALSPQNLAGSYKMTNSLTREGAMGPATIPVLTPVEAAEILEFPTGSSAVVHLALFHCVMADQAPLS